MQCSLSLPHSSVAEPEPLERQLFARAGTQVFCMPGSGYVNSYKMLQKAVPGTFSILKYEVKLKIFIVAIYLKELFNGH
jgi:hypothetical protein